MRRPFNGTYPVTQTFGVNPAAYRQFNIQGHNGVDYGLPEGTPVVAPHSGTVVESGFINGYGNYVKIQNGTEGSVLAHLSRRDVIAGTTVAEGQQLGLSGNTGNSTGPHLHWGYYRLPRNRANGYDGFIFQGPFLPTTVPVISPPPNSKEIPMNAQEETDAYRIVLNREPDITVPDGRNGIQFIHDAKAELAQQRLNSSNAIGSLQSQLNSTREELAVTKSQLHDSLDQTIELTKQKALLQSQSPVVPGPTLVDSLSSAPTPPVFHDSSPLTPHNGDNHTAITHPFGNITWLGTTSGKFVIKLVGAVAAYFGVSMSGIPVDPTLSAVVGAILGGLVADRNNPALPNSKKDW